MQWAYAFKRRGWNSILITGRTREPQEDFRHYTNRTGVPIITIEPLHREMEPLNDAKALLSLYRIIKKEKPDIVHTNSSKAGIIGRAAAWLNRIPVIIHSPHGHIFYGYYGRAKTKLFILLERLAAKITDKVITLTRLGRKDHIALKIAPPDKFIPIYCGIEVDKYSHPAKSPEEIRAELNIPAGKLLVGWVGRLTDIKGCEYFIEAAGELKKRENLHFLVVGSGENETKLREKAHNMGLEGRLTFTGQREDIPDMLSIMDIYSLSSLNEGLGRSILEAQAAGVPVVATNVGGVPEIVEDGTTGILVPPKDPKALAQAIEKLVDNLEFRILIAKNAWERLSYFSLKKTVEDLNKLYRKLLSKEK